VNKKTFICTLIVSLLAFAQIAMADYSIQATGGGSLNVGPWGYSDGGEFTFTTGGLDTSLYAGTTINQVSTTSYGNTFQTFCVENQVVYSPGTTYSAVLSQYSPKDSNHALTLGAAWLYWQFATGVLQSYDYTNTSTGRNNTAGLLQQEIWYLMGQTQAGFNPNNDVFNTLATNAIGASNLLNASNGAFGVYVLNLYTDSTHQTEVQDQLVLAGPNDEGLPAPTPIPAAAWLLGSGLMGLLGLRRKQKV